MEGKREKGVGRENGWWSGLRKKRREVGKSVEGFLEPKLPQGRGGFQKTKWTRLTVSDGGGSARLFAERDAMSLIISFEQKGLGKLKNAPVTAIHVVKPVYGATTIQGQTILESSFLFEHSRILARIPYPTMTLSLANFASPAQTRELVRRILAIEPPRETT
ncbi:hypothetical protein CIHG_04417 [Coccidioides immitis H538.4]|uniref:Uncharacterized protein n=3 Tax=Coccidioides immitis TaxID=5501 RepID=A0A0J8R6N1_COCIT|nr:hypothetical protein CIRG_09350 [Coccidioides immitis RMSCC 2394]KMU80080.1 hypothetical protein CISG_08421 [Coccidioides immitis RMSCC 3703]KMU86628.1 hypothetical protein CIHG_04417 [Coccidioides immitis H538.4]